MLNSELRAATGPARVVVADEQPAVRQGLIQRLAGEGSLLVVAQAVSVENAMQQVARLLPDVVVTDARLPESGGLDLSRRISALLPRTLCIIHSGNPIDPDEVFRAGAAAVVTKQLFGDELLRTIERLIMARNGADRSGP